VNFNFDEIRTVEFGVGRDDGDDHAFHCVMVDDAVQEALVEMAIATWDSMQEISDEPIRYQPSEKHAGCEYVYVPLDDDLSDRMRNLHEAENLDIDQDALNDAGSIFCYFSRLIDEQGRRLTALRRAVQFKGVLKSRLIQWRTDALKIVEDDVFKLDKDFDLLIDDERIHILRPSGFEFAGKLQEAILAAVDGNVNNLQQDLPFVKFEKIKEYARLRPRAARYLASIRSQQEVARIDRQHLLDACAATGVVVAEEDQGIVVHDKHVMGFLEVLDRRRYEVKLVPQEPEQYRAPSRTRLLR